MREFEIKFKLGIINKSEKVFARTFKYSPKERRLLFMDNDDSPVAMFTQGNWIKSVIMKVDSQEFDTDDVEITEQTGGWYKMEIDDKKY